MLISTPISAIPAIVASVREQSNARTAHSLLFRRQQLRNLHKMVLENQTELIAALSKDHGRMEQESFLLDVATVLDACGQALNNLDEWTQHEKVTIGNPLFFFDSCEVRQVSLGAVLIIGTWNLPVQLTLVPLVAAICGGNCAVLKLSEVAVHVSNTLSQLIPKYLDTEAYRVVTGAIPETSALLNEKFDLIFYTGNTQVGKIIMAAAAKTLTPVVLELGGKSPCIVDKNVDIGVSARRIMYGKIVNCGQTCVAPDYVLVILVSNQRLTKLS